MQRLTLIAAGLIGALSLSAAARAHGWEQAGDRQERTEDRGHEQARYEAPSVVRYDRVEILRLREAEARREAALRARRECFRPYAAAVVLAPRLPIPGGYLTLPGLVLNLR